MSEKIKIFPLNYGVSLYIFKTVALKITELTNTEVSK
jgi:hypothetical protein